MSAPRSATLTAAAQDCLKAVWSTREWTDEPVTISLLAGRLALSASTVSESVKKLTAEGLLAHQPYGAIDLTVAGRQVAVSMVRRHRLLETFLVEYLGYTWDEVHDDAEVLEHAVSDRFVSRLARRLGEPERDPHGDPIPREDGTLPELPAVRLDQVRSGRPVTVVRVSDRSPEVLRHVAQQGILLGRVLTVLDRQDPAGTLTVRIGDRDERLGVPAAQAVFVLPTDS